MANRVNNDFIFSNIKKETIVTNAESKLARYRIGELA